MSDKIQLIEEFVKKTTSGELAHDFQHASRVRKWALILAKTENYKDLEAVEIAALLHDIGLPFTEKRSLHGEKGAEIAIQFLEENSLCTPAQLSEISNAIRFHNSNRRGEGILLKITRDADMLDLFGAVGIIRAFTDGQYIGEFDPNNIKGNTWGMNAKDFDERIDTGIGIGDYRIDHLNFQISCYDNLWSETAKKIAEPMIEFIRNFILELEKEIEIQKSE